MLSGLRGQLALAARAEAEELLDSGRLTSSEVRQNLVDLARLNRVLPGGAGASITAVRRLVGRRRGVRVLDVGTGAADIPLRFAGLGWRTTAVDVNSHVLAVARGAAAGVAGVEIAEADARRLPFDDGAFDVAHCSLLLHHLEPDEATASLRELRRVARSGVVVNDLRRGVWPLAATWATTLTLARSPITRADGLVSARRAYTLPELDAMLVDAGLTLAWRSNAWMPRVVTAAAPR